LAFRPHCTLYQRAKCSGVTSAWTPLHKLHSNCRYVNNNSTTIDIKNMSTNDAKHNLARFVDRDDSDAMVVKPKTAEINATTRMTSVRNNITTPTPSRGASGKYN